MWTRMKYNYIIILNENCPSGRIVETKACDRKVNTTLLYWVVIAAINVITKKVLYLNHFLSICGAYWKFQMNSILRPVLMQTLIVIVVVKSDYFIVPIYACRLRYVIAENKKQKTSEHVPFYFA